MRLIVAEHEQKLKRADHKLNLPQFEKKSSDPTYLLRHQPKLEDQPELPVQLLAHHFWESHHHLLIAEAAVVWQLQRLHRRQQWQEK